MSEIVYTVCDQCNLKQELWAEGGGQKAVIECSPATAIQFQGWKEVDYGHLCPACVKAAAEQAALDGQQEAYSVFVQPELKDQLATLTREENKLLRDEAIEAVKTRLAELGEGAKGYTAENYVAEVKSMYATMRNTLRVGHTEEVAEVVPACLPGPRLLFPEAG
jgi:Fe-S-cluster-containing dehydrogenase component